MKKNTKHKDIFYVYIVRCAKGTYYTGYTNDLQNRIELHNKGSGAKYLRGKSPVELFYNSRRRHSYLDYVSPQAYELAGSGSR